MLTSLKLHDFRGIATLDMRFESDITVLVGPNGSGKTAVLDAIGHAYGSHAFAPTDVRLGADEAKIVAVSRTSAHPEADYSAIIRPDGSAQHNAGLGAHEFVLFFRTNRHVNDQTPGSTKPIQWTRDHALSGAIDASAHFDSFFTWMREVEDLENEQRIHEGMQENQQLAAVRRSVERLLPGYRDLRIRRQGAMGLRRPCMTIEKPDLAAPLVFDALSEGERMLVALVADTARRLVLYRSEAPEPLNEPLVLLVDEIEQHLHPGWQRGILRKLRDVFPAAQLIVTTQSPIIVSEIEPRCLRLFERFELVSSSTHSAGRDVNAILETTFDTAARRDPEKEILEQLQAAIDDHRLEEASSLLDRLSNSLGDDDPEVVFHRTLIERLRRAG